jgi:magnesium-transporting ATPase (P-type)
VDHKSWIKSSDFGSTIRLGKEKQVVWLFVIGAITACILAVLLTIGLSTNRELCFFGVATFFAATIIVVVLTAITMFIPAIFLNIKHWKKIKKLRMTGSPGTAGACMDSLYGKKLLLLNKVTTHIGIGCFLLWFILLVVCSSRGLCI